MSLLELIDVTKTYGAGETAVTALHGASLRMDAGEMLLLVGPSGSGKTTLLSIMGCILRPTAGQVLVDGVDAARLGEGRLPALRAHHFGYIFQHYHLFDALTAAENVEFALRMKFGTFPRPREEAARLLDVVGLSRRMHHKPAMLSGGERQRVAVARALAGGPPLILGDEPTAALDTGNALAVVELLRRLAREQGCAVAVVSHDHRLERYADRILHVSDGRLTETAPV